jgi:uncharacterized protein YkwD
MSNPTAQEQEFLELINRLRTEPVAELDLLLNSSDPTTKAAIDGALAQFKTNRATLRSQWDKLDPAAPLAWSSALNQAAAAHNQLMIAADIQSHGVGTEKDLVARLADAGYDISQGGTVAENIFAAVDSIVYAEAGLAIDWGDDDPTTPKLEAIDGIQTATGHRDNLLDSKLREVGVSVTATNGLAKQNVGPLVVNQNFGNRTALNEKAYILGVAFDDKNLDGYYQAGEGISDVNIKVTNIATNVSQELIVGAAGGYQQLVNPGEYQVEFTQGGVIQTATASISAKDPQNVKLDFVVPNLIVQNNVPATGLLTKDPINFSPTINTTIDLVKRTTTAGLPEISNNLVLSVTALGGNLQDGKSGSNLFDFTRDFTQAGTPNLALRNINAKFSEVSADASYRNYAGLYRVDDVAGKIGNLNPGDAGYMTAALKRSKEVNRGVEFDRDGISAKNLDGGYIYAPFVVADGTVDQVLNSSNPKTTPRVYFNYVAANADGFDHIKSLGANKFGFEDTYGGGDKDYNDLIFKVEANVTSIVG